jgi:hypothetical protein
LLSITPWGGADWNPCGRDDQDKEKKGKEKVATPHDIPPVKKTINTRKAKRSSLKGGTQYREKNPYKTPEKSGKTALFVKIRH